MKKFYLFSDRFSKYFSKSYMPTILSSEKCLYEDIEDDFIFNRIIESLTVIVFSIFNYILKILEGMIEVQHLGRFSFGK